MSATRVTRRGLSQEGSKGYVARIGRQTVQQTPAPRTILLLDVPVRLLRGRELDGRRHVERARVELRVTRRSALGVAHCAVRQKCKALCALRLCGVRLGRCAGAEKPLRLGPSRGGRLRCGGRLRGRGGSLADTWRLVARDGRARRRRPLVGSGVRRALWRWRFSAVCGGRVRRPLCEKRQQVALLAHPAAAERSLHSA